MGGRLSLESRFPSFEEAIDVADEMRQRRHARGKTLAMRAIAALLIVAAICIGGFPAMLQYRSARDLSGTSVRSAQTVASWPYPQADDAFAAAQDYNKRLAESGQPILGEAKDPFADVRGGSRASVSDSAESDNQVGESGPQMSDSAESDSQSDENGSQLSDSGESDNQSGADASSASASSADAEYQGLLDSGGGVMGTIRIPKISVRLPIYHAPPNRRSLRARATCTAAACQSAARARMRCSPGIADWSKRPCSRGLMKCASATTSI